VKEYYEEKRKGVIIASDQVDVKSLSLWSALFEGKLKWHEQFSSGWSRLTKRSAYLNVTIVKDFFPENWNHGIQWHGGGGGFLLEEFGEELVLIKNENFGCPFLKLMLLHLWPGKFFLLGTYTKEANPRLTLLLHSTTGNWREQLQNLNICLEERNVTVWEHEWWIVWGIMIISACSSEKGRHKLFKNPSEHRFAPAMNLGEGGQ
jgi:hypothetical protein